MSIRIVSGSHRLIVVVVHVSDGLAIVWINGWVDFRPLTWKGSREGPENWEWRCVNILLQGNGTNQRDGIWYEDEYTARTFRKSCLIM